MPATGNDFCRAGYDSVQDTRCNAETQSVKWYSNRSRVIVIEEQQTIPPPARAPPLPLFSFLSLPLSGESEDGNTGSETGTKHKRTDGAKKRDGNGPPRSPLSAAQARSRLFLPSCCRAWRSPAGSERESHSKRSVDNGEAVALRHHADTDAGTRTHRSM